ncbi:hypothetical protein NCER_101883 [Vairimorpha ceranae BRL01]|uniref:Uncharacterized protein n=2 Tax=Vairimorpha ceranae TaxID=40302 RepID=C4VAY0_VAIC1|nr:hypothetical protein AAJ76_8000111530 [Vairimorpha ceranae]EEQ81623.1 hypothetical protein NCER_101883 [Vairimorpha ceranae BRL01]KKO76036.1 hypothetical protein AAJ76_8000111530 [Vairimorpha ceranae]
MALSSCPWIQIYLERLLACLTSKVENTLDMKSLQNSLPLSVCKRKQCPLDIKIGLIAEITDEATLTRKGTVHINLENESMTTSINIYPSFTFLKSVRSAIYRFMGSLAIMGLITCLVIISFRDRQISQELSTSKPSSRKTPYIIDLHKLYSLSQTACPLLT